MNETVLIKRAQNGDSKAFELLIEAHFKKIYNIAYRISGNPDDASDMTQEVMIKLFRNINSFEGNSKFSTWVYRVATNTCLDELKKLRRHSTYSINSEISADDSEFQYEVEDTAPTPDLEVERNELSDMVAKAITFLNPEHRAIITLRDIQEFSYEEIANILNISEGTVKSRISRARMQLKKILERDFKFGGTYFKE